MLVSHEKTETSMEQNPKFKKRPYFSWKFLQYDDTKRLHLKLVKERRTSEQEMFG